MPLLSQRSIGLVLVVVSAIIFSSAGLFVKGVEADSWSIIFWRGLSAALFTGVYILWRRSWHREINQMGRVGVLAAAVGASSTMAFIPAFKLTSIANVSLIWAAAPLVSAVVAWFWFREKPVRSVLLASVAAFMGVLLIVSGSLGTLSLKGDLLAVWMTVGMALFLCIYRRYPGTPAAGPAVLMSIMLLPFALAFSTPFAIDPHEILVTCCFGLVFSIASVTMAEGAKRLSAIETALIGALETPLAPIWAFVFFSEIPTRYTVVGGSIVLLSVFIAEWSGRKPGGS